MKSLLLLFILINCLHIVAQNDSSGFELQADYFYGNFIPHNKNIKHLIKGHPTGFIVSFNKKTKGDKWWHQAYHYPDWGFSFQYQDNKNKTLGTTAAVLGHIHFYSFNRKIQWEIAQGIAYNTNPFDIDTNLKNYAFGSHLLSTTRFGVTYVPKSLINKMGLQLGLLFMHYSNGGVKAPNTGINSVVMKVGLTYGRQEHNKDKETEDPIIFEKNWSYVMVVRGGVNSSDYIGLGQQSFWVFAGQVQKKLTIKSTVLAGSELFLTKSLQKEIEYISVAFPNRGVTGNEDYKRVGVFLGHQLHIGKWDALSHIGYYVYYPYDFMGRWYQRIGLNYHFSTTIFGSISLKTHLANAEAIEIGIGIQLLKK